MRDESGPNMHASDTDNLPDWPRNTVSVVVPVYNEAKNLPELCTRLCRVLNAIDEIGFEIILVDDGSRDNSWAVICELHEQNPQIKGVRLSRNFGHQAALTAGYDRAVGDAVIAMDGDLQHPPELLPGMIREWRSGYEVVSMVRQASPDESWLKRLSSALFYRLINALSDITIRNAVADFRLLDRHVLKQLNGMRERARFVRGLISWIGFKETELHYTASPRFSGTTQYSLRKMLRLAVNAISSFSTIPLTMGFYAGLVANVICVFLFGYAVYNKIYEHKDLSEWASLFITMLFLNGIQLTMLSILGLYVGRVLEEVKQRPVYIARNELGIAPKRRRNALRRAERLAASEVRVRSESAG